MKVQCPINRLQRAKASSKRMGTASTMNPSATGVELFEQYEAISLRFDRGGPQLE